MSLLFSYLKTYWKEEIKLNYLLLIVGFLILNVFLEYHAHFFSNLMKPYKRTEAYYFANVLFFCVPIFYSVLTYIFCYVRRDLFRNPSFWFTLLYIIFAFSLCPYFYFQRDLVIKLNSGVPDGFLIKCATQVSNTLLIFVTVFVFWRFSGHYKETTFYGFKLKEVDIKPYLYLLLVLIPLVAFASCKSDFLHKYPTFARFIKGNSFGYSVVSKVGVYEILYGFNFVAIELFFRGFVLYTLSKYMGKGAIMTMACMYVFIHFGKPMGETISSFFGAMFLGIIAFETRSILAGIVLHCGIAYMMEIGGFIGNSY